MIRVAVNGAFGKMGLVTTSAISSNCDMDLVGTWGKDDNLQLSLQQTTVDVIVDFTLPHCVFQNTITAIEHKVCPVVGATGLTSAQLKEIEDACKANNTGCVIAPNFSISAVLMMQFAAQAARFMPSSAIIEMHHPDKVDSPSGTAITTANLMQQSTKTKEQVPINSVRLPGMFAHQQVIFSAAGERLTIQQDCTNREAMMQGVQLAIKHAFNSKNMTFGLEDILRDAI